MKKILIILSILLGINLLVITASKAFAFEFDVNLQQGFEEIDK